MLAAMFSGALIALSFSAPPGPVAMETVRRGLRGGFWAGFKGQLGPVIADFMWFLISLLGLAPLAQDAWVGGLLASAGGGVLRYLGGSGIRNAFKTRIAQLNDWVESKQSAFRRGMAISIANPMGVGYWVSVGGALVAAGLAGTTPTQTVSFVAGFVGGTVAWAFLMAFAIRWGQRLIGPGVFRAINFVCGSALIIFGITSVSQMLG